MHHDSELLARARALVDAAMTDPQRCSALLAQAQSLLIAAAASTPDEAALLACLGAVLAATWEAYFAPHAQ